MKEERAEIVKSGTWLYDSIVTHEVWIVKQNFEYWYEEGFDGAERLNAHGELFAVLYAHDGRLLRPCGSEFFSIEEAVAAAVCEVPQGVQWDNHRLQALFGGRRYSLRPQP
jgi:hypothetical protein